MIPKNNLDDRTFDDIVEEAIRLIPRYCPEWTNHNPSDPGIALVELFAWMTELVIYRLNQVPEKTYLSLLELIGLSLTPPQPARAVMRFFPMEGYKKSIRVPAGTKITAVVADDSTYSFETEYSISIIDSELAACVNRTGEKWHDYCKNNVIKPFVLFETSHTVEHILYIASPVFSYLSQEHSAQILFVAANEITSVHDEITNFIHWEYWDGRSWVHIETKSSTKDNRKKDNVVYFDGPVNIEENTVNGFKGYYLRGILAEVPQNRKAMQIKNIGLKAFLSARGFLPDNCFTHAAAAYNEVDFHSNFRIFSENPEYDEAFYIGSDEVFGSPGNKVTIMFEFSDVYVPGGENENAKFSYEYWDGNNWNKIGESPRSDVNKTPFGFNDGTFAFKRSGEVKFKVPPNLKKTIISKKEHYWIRIRLQTKDFALGGIFSENAGGNWMWRFSAKVHSPMFSKIRLTYNAGEQVPDQVFSNSNFLWNDLGALIQQNNKNNLNNKEYQDSKPELEFSLFNILQDSLPSLYLGFSASFPNGSTSIYVKIDDEQFVRPKEKVSSFVKELQAAIERRGIDLEWEYWDGTKWSLLAVNDYTDSFHESGFISGSFEVQPTIISIFNNAVYAQNRTGFKNEVVGSGTGAPSQSVSVTHGPLLPGMEIHVNEGSIPPTNEINMMIAEGVKEPYYIENKAVWVRYKEVDNFFNSCPFSRHFVVDYRERKIYFGDGQHGMNPPGIKFNIKVSLYFTGGGACGNVAAGTLRTLTQSISYVGGCDNPFPAEGGADMEDVDNLKSRSAGAFKSLQRAVTAEDFQWLSLEASASVGKAWCLKDKNQQGEIVVIVIPVIPSGKPLSYKLVPSRELIRRVTSYLDVRKLVGTKLRVRGPIYRVFSTILTLVFKSDVLDEERLKKKHRNIFAHIFPCPKRRRWQRMGIWEINYKRCYIKTIRKIKRHLLD